MAGKTKPGSALKGINIKLKMINDLMDVTGSAKDSWNPAEISDDMKAIDYIHRLADTWNPAQLNEALKYLGFDTIDSWNPAIIEETKNKLVKYFLPMEATGNPIELDLKGVFPYEVTALTIDLLPIQDLHGYDSPWVGGAGKNKLNAPDVALSSSGYIYNGTCDIKAGTYTISFNGGSSATIVFYDADGNALTSGSHNVPWTFTISADAKSAKIYVPEAGTYAEIMIEQGSTKTSYAPYENICPISGRNSVTLTVNGDDTEITFEDTVYGGNVNVLEGGTSSTYGYIASYDSEELPGAWISDRDAYAAGTEPTTGAEVAYILAAPTELTTPANEIDLVNGENNLSTDGDNINITYKANLNS